MIIIIDLNQNDIDCYKRKGINIIKPDQDEPKLNKSR